MDVRGEKAELAHSIDTRTYSGSITMIALYSPCKNTNISFDCAFVGDSAHYDNFDASVLASHVVPHSMVVLLTTLDIENVNNLRIQCNHVPTTLFSF